MNKFVSQHLFFAIYEESKDHHIVPLPSLAEQLRKMLTDVNQKLYEKMKRCREFEKSAWRKFSNAEDHIHQVHKEVDQAADDLVGYSFVAMFSRIHPCQIQLDFLCTSAWIRTHAHIIET